MRGGINTSNLFSLIKTRDNITELPAEEQKIFRRILLEEVKTITAFLKDLSINDLLEGL